MMSKISTTTVFVVITFFAAHVAAWPTGAGACPKGEAAVNGPHMVDNPTTGSLEDAPQDLQVLLNGSPVSLGASVSVGETANVQIVSDLPFKGFLIRLDMANDDDATTMAMQRSESSTTDLTMALNPVTDDAADVKVEELYCIPAGVAGVCHTSNTTKTSVAATLDVPSAGEYMMDVTVVIALNAATGTSEFYYSGYMVQATGGETTGSEAGDATTAPAPSPAPSSPAPAGNTTAPNPTEEPSDVTPSPTTAASGSVPMFASALSLAMLYASVVSSAVALIA